RPGSWVLFKQPNDLLILPFTGKIQRGLAIPPLGFPVRLVGEEQFRYFGPAVGSSPVERGKFATRSTSVHVNSVGQQHLRDLDVAQPGREVQRRPAVRRLGAG